MPQENVEDLRLAEDRQRRRATLISNLLYAQPDPSGSPELARELKETDQKRKQLEDQRRTAESKDREGVLLSTNAAANGTMLGADTTGIELNVLSHMSHVPTATVNLLDKEQAPLISFAVKNVKDDTVRLRLTSWVEGYSAQAVDTVEVPVDQSVEVKHLPTFFPASLAPVTELTRATLRIKVDDLDGKPEQESSYPIWLLARTTAYLTVRDPANGNSIDLTPYFAAWVTPNVPAVMEIVREAASLHPDGSIGGYQGDAMYVEAQVRAIYEAVKAKDITYVNSVVSFGAAEGESMQRVRLPSEAVRSRSANCIDGTLLMSSALEAASLNPGIVLVPGHAFLAWEMSDGRGEWDYLETTMIGSHGFDEAQAAGRSQAKAHEPVKLLSITELRAKYGITPME